MLFLPLKLIITGIIFKPYPPPEPKKDVKGGKLTLSGKNSESISDDGLDEEKVPMISNSINTSINSSKEEEEEEIGRVVVDGEMGDAVADRAVKER